MGVGLTSWAVLSSPSVRALCPHPTHPELPRGPVRRIHTGGAGASRTHPGITVILCFPQLQNSIFLTQTGWGAANMSSPHPTFACQSPIRKKTSYRYCLIAVAVLVTQSCLTLFDPTNCSPSDFSLRGILWARILEWIVIAFSRGSS